MFASRAAMSWFPSGCYRLHFSPLGMSECLRVAKNPCLVCWLFEQIDARELDYFHLGSQCLLQCRKVGRCSSVVALFAAKGLSLNLILEACSVNYSYYSTFIFHWSALIFVYHKFTICKHFIHDLQFGFSFLCNKRWWLFLHHSGTSVGAKDLNICKNTGADDSTVTASSWKISDPLQDVISYNAAISACGRSGRWHEALLLVNQLEDDLLQCYPSLWAPFFVCRCAYGVSFSGWKLESILVVVLVEEMLCFFIHKLLFHDCFMISLLYCGYFTGFVLFIKLCRPWCPVLSRMPKRFCKKPRQSCDLQCFDPLIYQSRPLGVGIWFFSHCEELGLWKDANLISND